MSERRKDGQFKPVLKVPVNGEGGMTLAMFRADETAIAELNAFLNTETGVKLRQLMVGVSPLRLLCAAADALDPVRMRVLPKVEGEAAASIMQREIGWQSLAGIITGTLPRETIPASPRAQLIRDLNKLEKDD